MQWSLIAVVVVLHWLLFTVVLLLPLESHEREQWENILGAAMASGISVLTAGGILLVGITISNWLG